MPTPVDSSVPDPGAQALITETSPFVDHTIDYSDEELARPDIDTAQAPTDINVPLLNLSSKAVGLAGGMNPQARRLGFFREAGKAVRNAVDFSKTAEAVTLASIILDDAECNPIALAAQLDAATSKEWRGWLPESLCDHLEVTEDDVASRDKLLATQVGVCNSDVFSDWSLFTAVSSAFNHRRSNFQWLDKPTYIEAAWTCFALRQLQPGVEFHSGVTKFLVALMIEDGLCFFPWTGGPGLGLGVNDEGISAGLTDVGDLALKIRKLWETGDLHDVTLSDHDESDPLHVQLAKIAAAQEYIKAQHASQPSEYKTKTENENA